MEYFETLGQDGRTYLHYDRWQQWRWECLNKYPCAPGRFRFDIELAYPQDRLSSVPVRYPQTHSRTNLDPHTCFYECDDWSTIYGEHDAHLYYTGGPSFRMLIESGNGDPLWGDRVTLFSTSCCIENEPWGQNPPNRFAYFRDKFWQVTWCQFLSEWRPPIRYPLSNFDGHMKSDRMYLPQHMPLGEALVKLPFREEPLRGLRAFERVLGVPPWPRRPDVVDDDLFEVIRHEHEMWRLTHGYNLDWKRFGF